MYFQTQAIWENVGGKIYYTLIISWKEIKAGMLKIYYGDMQKDNYIFDPDTFFNHQYLPEWLVDELSVKMIQDIDRSEVVSEGLIKSPILGFIPPERLSGGVKTLILILKDADHIFNVSACGDNCAKWLLKISENRDVTVRLGYLMDFGKEPFQIQVLNTGNIVHSLTELDNEVIDNGLLRGEL